MDKAGETLVYSNSDMEIKGVINDSELELPKNTLITFKHVLTTPKKDRDGDILRTDGAAVDPKMLLLWQHVHTLPIGKMLQVAHHDSQKLSLVSCIVDMNELCHDAAVMIDNDMGRFSHGFRALEFSEVKEEEGDTTGPGGFDIKKFEIMEASLVSVPANTDAEVEEVILGLVESKKLNSEMMKTYGKSIRSSRDPSISVTYKEKLGDYEREITAPNAGEFEKIFDKARKEDESKTKQESTSSSEETNAAPEKGAKEGRETQTSDKEVTTETKSFWGPITGSWEDIECKLRDSSKSFLEDSGAITFEEHRGWTWSVGTFADHQVICAEKGDGDPPQYFKASWEMKDGEPTFVGQPKEVQVEVSVQLLEAKRAKALEMFEKTSEEGTQTADKAGRVLSKENVKRLKEVVTDLKELDDLLESRAGKALCKECMTKGTTVVDSAGTGEEEEGKATYAEIFKAVISEWTPEQQTKLADVLKVLQDQRESADTVKQFKALIGAEAS